MKEYQYRIRAHHGMCISFFKGEGYCNEFTEHMAKIIHKLKKNPLIYISDEADTICEKCPHNKSGICEIADKVKEYDRQVLLHCNLSTGSILPFIEFQSKISKNIIDSGKRETICGDCQWSSLCHSKKVQ